MLRVALGVSESRPACSCALRTIQHVRSGRNHSGDKRLFRTAVGVTIFHDSVVIVLNRRTPNANEVVPATSIVRRS